MAQLDYEKSFITQAQAMNIIVPRQVKSDEITFDADTVLTKAITLPSGFRFYAVSFFTKTPIYWTTEVGTDLAVKGWDRHWFEGGRFTHCFSESKSTIMFRPAVNVFPTFDVKVMVG